MGNYRLAVPPSTALLALARSGEPGTAQLVLRSLAARGTAMLLELAPLDAPQVTATAGAFLGVPAPGRARGRPRDRSGGLPLAVEELLRDAVCSKALCGRRGRAHDGDSGRAAPAGVVDSVRRQVSALPAEVRSMLAAARRLAAASTSGCRRRTAQGTGPRPSAAGRATAPATSGNARTCSTCRGVAVAHNLPLASRAQPGPRARQRLPLVLPRGSTNGKDLLTRLGHGTAAAARFADDLAASRALAAASPPVKVAPAHSRLTAEVAIRAHSIDLPNSGCGECGGVAPRPVVLHPIVWKRVDRGPDSVWDGTIVTGLFTTTVNDGVRLIVLAGMAQYVPGQGWHTNLNAC